MAGPAALPSDRMGGGDQYPIFQNFEGILPFISTSSFDVEKSEAILICYPLSGTH